MPARRCASQIGRNVMTTTIMAAMCRTGRFLGRLRLEKIQIGSVSWTRR
jgi:hypothetical protein